MPPVIYASINPFLMDVKIYKIENKNQIELKECKINELESMIPIYCKQTGIQKVMLNGPTEYINSIVSDIYHYNRNKYDNFNIEIEVVK